MGYMSHEKKPAYTTQLYEDGINHYKDPYCNQPV